MKFRLRIIFIIGVTVLMLSLLNGYIDYRESRDHIREQARTHLNGVVNKVAGEINCKEHERLCI